MFHVLFNAFIPEVSYYIETLESMDWFLYDRDFHHKISTNVSIFIN